jgi:hypothetical protein
MFDYEALPRFETVTFVLLVFTLFLQFLFDVKIIFNNLINWANTFLKTELTITSQKLTTSLNTN